MGTTRRERLRDPADAPATGETFHELLSARGVLIEEILSGASAEPTPYLQDHDEWVVVLAGGALLDVDGERCELEAGEWLLLPRDVAHTVIRTQPGTHWLAVHLPA
jgi:cupin 2 domain-containing protein